MASLWYYFLKISCTILRYIHHTVLAILYWGKGKTVPPVRNALLLMSATKLAEEIREGRLRSQDICQAFMARILEVDPYINATVQRCFQEAMREAKEVDRFIAAGGHSKEQLAAEKPLLGVPFSVKVILTMKGIRSTAGSLLTGDMVANEDSPAVALMRKAGAVLIAATNTAEFGMGFETSNKRHGTTCNPYDTSRTSGGSSGGESALISAAGSVIGLGNDIAGSVRMPGHCTGIFGHKATMGMIPSSGSYPMPDAKIERFLYTGPMCRYAEDLVTMMKVLSSQYEIPVQFGKPFDFKKLKIYYMLSIHNPLCAPLDGEILQALKNAINFFQTTYNVPATEIKLPLMNTTHGIVINNLQYPVDDMKEMMMAGKGSHINAMLEFIKILIGKNTVSAGPLIVLLLGKLPFWYHQNDYLHYKTLLEKLSDQFNDLLDENSVFLYPTLPFHAPYHTEITSPLFLPSTYYTSIFNMVGLPSTQCPMGLSRKGLPHGIQIIGRKDNDALTVACAEELEKAFGGWISPGSTKSQVI